MRQLFLSGHSSDMAACPARFWYYRICGRASAEVSPALVQGIAGHGALARWRKGKPQAEQDAFIAAVYAAHPSPAEDYRHSQYLKEAITQYKAEYPELSAWEFEEVERDGQVVLGVVDTRRCGQVEVVWVFRRDAVVVVRETGQRWIVDNKFVSRDMSADVAAQKNSGALKGYCWAWQKEAPEKPVVGAILRRTVIRPPSKAAALNFGLPVDPPFYFSQETLGEWLHHTLLKAVEILERDPEMQADWRMESALCRGPYGCCDYLDVCTLPPADRLVMLRTDAFRDAKERETYDEEAK